MAFFALMEREPKRLALFKTLAWSRAIDLLRRKGRYARRVQACNPEALLAIEMRRCA